MGNHLHVVIQSHSGDLASCMHALAFRYAQYYNKKYNRVGYLYQGRYKVIVVQSGMYLRHLVRYVHLNPVRAKIVKSPAEYVWSSYNMYLGCQDCTWLNRTLILDAFGTNENDSIKKLSRYTELDDIESQNEAIAIRNSLHAGAYGDSVFLEKWLPLLRGDTVHSHIITNGAIQVSMEDIIETVCRHMNMSLTDIQSVNRSKQHILARGLIACLTHKLHSGSMKGLGEYISRDPTSLARLVEKNKENSHVQNLLDELAMQLMHSRNSS